MASSKTRTPSSDWLVQVPLSELLALQGMATELKAVQEENARLGKRVDGLHATVYKLMELVQECKSASGRRA